MKITEQNCHLSQLWFQERLLPTEDHRRLLPTSITDETIITDGYQLAASSTYTGTDTDAFAYSNGGVPSALISIPLKYMHSSVETLHKKDIEYTIQLIYNTLLNIEENHNFKYNR